jgi:hypothetical protein
MRTGFATIFGAASWFGAMFHVEQMTIPGDHQAGRFTRGRVSRGTPAGAASTLGIAM